MYKKGISVYTGLKDYNTSETICYLKKAASYGFDMVFSSAHINEATNEYQDLLKILECINELDMKLILDISKKAFEKFLLPKNLYALRLDYGFLPEDIVELSNRLPCKIELNASTITKEKLEELINQGLNIKNVRFSFNFYPKLYTGHDISFVKEKIALFKKYGAEIMIFIPSKTGFRPPMYEGLPTIEAHRFMSLDDIIEEIKTLDVDEVIFGDAYASDEELKILSEKLNECLSFPIKLFSEMDTFYSHLDGVFQIRCDYNNYLLRCTSKRGISVLPKNQIERKKGFVTIDNDLFKRYQGEINIVLQDLPKDERVNVIGEITLTNHQITALKQGQKFTFTKKHD